MYINLVIWLNLSVYPHHVDYPHHVKRLLIHSPIAVFCCYCCTNCSWFSLPFLSCPFLSVPFPCPFLSFRLLSFPLHEKHGPSYHVCLIYICSHLEVIHILYITSSKLARRKAEGYRKRTVTKTSENCRILEYKLAVT